jgi:hypothetical protein
VVFFVINWVLQPASARPHHPQGLAPIYECK